VRGVPPRGTVTVTVTDSVTLDAIQRNLLGRPIKCPQRLVLLSLAFATLGGYKQFGC